MGGEGIVAEAVWERSELGSLFVVARTQKEINQ